MTQWKQIWKSNQNLIWKIWFDYLIMININLTNFDFISRTSCSENRRGSGWHWDFYDMGSAFWRAPTFSFRKQPCIGHCCHGLWAGKFYHRERTWLEMKNRTDPWFFIIINKIMVKVSFTSMVILRWEIFPLGVGQTDCFHFVD